MKALLKPFVEAVKKKGICCSCRKMYYQAEEGKLKPTRKGISFKVGLLPDILEGLNQAKAEIPA